MHRSTERPGNGFFLEDAFPEDEHESSFRVVKSVFEFVSARPVNSVAPVKAESHYEKNDAEEHIHYRPGDGRKIPHDFSADDFHYNLLFDNRDISNRITFSRQQAKEDPAKNRCYRFTQDLFRPYIGNLL